MKVKHSNAICVIGAGRFGGAVITQLLELGKEVVAIDNNKETLKSFQDQIEEVYILDATDIKALKAISIEKYGTVVVAVGNMINIEIVSALIELKVNNIIAKASTKRHAKVLRQIGVNVIVNPEVEAGTRTALIAGNQNFILYSDKLLELTDDFVIGSTMLRNPTLFNQKIRDIKLNENGVTVVLIRRNKVTMQVHGNFVLQEGDEVSLVGKVPDVNSAFEWLNNSQPKVN